MAPNLPFTEEDLRRAAGPASYARGLGYLERVENLEIDGSGATATVFGTDAYQVRLRFGDAGRGVRGECSCPFGAEGNFCKHCVATGLAALKRGDFLAGRTQASSAAEPESGSLVSWLTSLSRDELLTELLQLLVDEPDLIQRFELRAAAAQVDVEGVRETIRDLIWVTDGVDYDEAGAYANDVTRAADAIEELIDAGAAVEAIAVVRDAIGWLRQSFEMVDDSEGDVANAGHELLQVHLLACQAAPPDPVELAAYLAELCLTDGWGFAPAFADYAELLGHKGWAALRKRIRHAYMANPNDYRARHLMESVIEAEGDVDALVALYAAHLDERGWQHLRIAQKLESAGRGDEALGWAERGVRDLPRPDDRLVEYLADRYTAAGRIEDLVEMRRTLFAAARTLANFRALRKTAVDCGVWEAERGSALGLLGKDAAAAQRTLWSTWAGPVLIDALIDEGNLAAARAAAQDIASEARWIRLANASVTKCPAEALAVYVKVIERLTQHTGDAVYRHVAEHVLAVRACHEALGTMDEFRRYMVLLRMAQKRKRNLMKILDQNGL
jgi:uncharacterized Zn finger protein